MCHLHQHSTIVCNTRIYTISVLQLHIRPESPGKRTSGRTSCSRLWCLRHLARSRSGRSGRWWCLRQLSRDRLHPRHGHRIGWCRRGGEVHCMRRCVPCTHFSTSCKHCINQETSPSSSCNACLVFEYLRHRSTICKPPHFSVERSA
jgi:hypothetical protein